MPGPCRTPGSRCGTNPAAGANSPRPVGGSEYPGQFEAILQPLMPWQPIVQLRAVPRTSPSRITMVATAMTRRSMRTGQENVANADA